MAAFRLLLMLLLVLMGSVSATSPQVRRRRPWAAATVDAINRKGPYVGLISVYAPEEDVFFATAAFIPCQDHPFVDLSGRRFRVGSIGTTKAIYVRCGVGMVNAAAATQQMLDVFDMIGVVHFGIAGNANSSMSVGDVIVLDQIAQTGLWDWLKPNATEPANAVAELNLGSEDNGMGTITYQPECFYSESEKPNEAQCTLWFQTSQEWLKLASGLQGMELQRCINSSFCLARTPKLAVGLNGATSNIFIDNAAYREFLFKTFHVSTIDMESAAIVMTSLSNGFKVIVIRGLSDLAGAQRGDNTVKLFGPLAASNVAKAVVQFVKILGGQHFQVAAASL